MKNIIYKKIGTDVLTIRLLKGLLLSNQHFHLFCYGWTKETSASENYSCNKKYIYFPDFLYKIMK